MTGNYKDIYGKAIAAKDKKQWKQAQSFFEDAIALNGKDTAEPINISGFGNVEPYVPHFYLGVVLRAQNNCAGALKEFDLSEQSGAIQKSRLNSALSQERKACGSKP